MRKPLPLTLHPTVKQAQDWADGARFMGASVPGFVMTCASWGAKYFPAQERAKRPDAVALRVEEKGKLAALLQAATQALQHLPPPFRSALYGEMRDPAGDLRRAIDAVHEFQAKHGERWE